MRKEHEERLEDLIAFEAGIHGELPLSPEEEAEKIYLELIKRLTKES